MADRSSLPGQSRLIAGAHIPWLLGLLLGISSCQSGPKPFPWTAEAMKGPFPLPEAVLEQINLLRQHPASFIRDLKAYRARFEGHRVRLSRNEMLLTQEGPRAVDEAIAFLGTASPLSPVRLSRGMSRAALDHVRDLGPRGTTGHTGKNGSTPHDRMSRYGKAEIGVAENLEFGPATARDVVMMLLIDDGVPDRGHRRNFFTRNFRMLGIACGPHAVYGRMCVIDFAGAFSEAN